MGIRASRAISPSALSRARALHFRPVKNLEVTESHCPGGTIILVYPVSPHPWIRALLKRFGAGPPSATTRKLELDELGGYVWRLLDGRNRVVDVIEAFATAHRLSEEEAEPAVTQFLRALGKRGLIAMAEPATDLDARPG